MNSTAHFKNTIKAYLDKRANEDSLFAQVYAKADKNLDGCIHYILNEVRKSGCNGFTDEEVFGMAVHYYDEDNIAAGKPIDGCRIVVNHVVELTAEEKEAARKEAIQRSINEAYNSIIQPKKPQKKTAEKQDEKNIQPNLFDF